MGYSANQGAIVHAHYSESILRFIKNNEGSTKVHILLSIHIKLFLKINKFLLDFFNSIIEFSQI